VHEFPSNLTSSKPFACRLAFGNNRQASSGIWRVWAAKNRPHLFCAVTRISGHVKATVHCPSTEYPTFKRHWGFVYFEEGKAPGEVAEMVRATGESRHKATWKGADVGGGFTLEWRIFFPESSRRVAPLAVDARTQLMPMPGVGECGVVFVMLGEPHACLRSANLIGAEPKLLKEGRLSDGRPVYIFYAYFLAPPLPSPSVLQPTKFLSKSALRSPNDELRVQAISDAEDGSLVFWDLRAVRTLPEDA
jgi:hypothetical protein